MSVDPQRLLETLVRIGKAGVGFGLAGLAGYAVAGSLFSSLVSPLPYRFLAIDADPVFNSLFVLVGAAAAVMSGALVFHAGITRANPTDRAIVVFAGSLGVGFGTSLVRICLPVVFQYVMD